MLTWKLYSSAVEKINEQGAYSSYFLAVLALTVSLGLSKNMKFRANTLQGMVFFLGISGRIASLLVWQACC